MRVLRVARMLLLCVRIFTYVAVSTSPRTSIQLTSLLYISDYTQQVYRYTHGFDRGLHGGGISGTQNRCKIGCNGCGRVVVLAVAVGVMAHGIKSQTYITNVGRSVYWSILCCFKYPQSSYTDVSNYGCSKYKMLEKKSS